MKVCSRCGTAGEFYKDKSKKDGLHSICKTCHIEYKKNLHSTDSEARNRANERSRQYRISNPITYKTSITNSTLKSKYGITLKEYNNLLMEQENKCKVCGEPPIKQRLHVDHNHETGEIRGLLCQACNVSIGKMKESPELLEKLAKYIRREL